MHTFQKLRDGIERQEQEVRHHASHLDDEASGQTGGIMFSRIPRLAQKSCIFIHAGGAGINIGHYSVGTLRKAAQGQLIMAGYNAAYGQLLELF